MKLRASIPFTKMHGLGNDFVIMDGRHPSFSLDKTCIPQWAHRHLGIGFDQLLVMETATNADFFCRIYNADGSMAEQCGNGLRCLARYIHEEGLHTEKAFTIATSAGIFPVSIEDYDHITLTLSPPVIEKKLCNVNVTEGENPTFSVINLGNPHAIIRVDNLDLVKPEMTVKLISQHGLFPQGVNIGWLKILDRHHIQLRTLERGSGETLACGSNACAAVVAGIANNWLSNAVQVQLRYGTLDISWPSPGEGINLCGPATRVFSGELTTVRV